MVRTCSVLAVAEVSVCLSSFVKRVIENVFHSRNRQDKRHFELLYLHEQNTFKTKELICAGNSQGSFKRFQYLLPATCVQHFVS